MKAKLTSETIVAGLLMLAPLAMTVARRSSALLMAVAALITLFVERKNWSERWQHTPIDKALLAGLVLLIGWGAVSLTWSLLPARGAKQLIFDFAIPVASGIVLIVLQTPQRTRPAAILFAAALALAGIMVAAQLHFQIRIEDVLTQKGQAPEAWRFNMVVVTLALFVPALMMLMRAIPIPAALAILAIIAASVASQSATSKLVLLSGVFSYGLVRLLPRRLSLFLFSLTLFGILAVQPWQGLVVEQSLRAAGKTEILFQSAKERIVIWQASGRMALHAMPWGLGMGSSDAAIETPFAKSMTAEEAVGLRQTHAHDAFLNVILELGVPGLIGLALIALGIIRMMARLSNALYAPAMALAVQVITVDLISHGAWQAWWFTAILLATLALRQYAPPDDQASR